MYIYIYIYICNRLLQITIITIALTRERVTSVFEITKH